MSCCSRAKHRLSTARHLDGKFATHLIGRELDERNRSFLSFLGIAPLNRRD